MHEANLKSLAKEHEQKLIIVILRINRGTPRECMFAAEHTLRSIGKVHIAAYPQMWLRLSDNATCCRKISQCAVNVRGQDQDS